jgi:RES domain
LTCRAPAPPLEPLFERWPAGELIHVIHDTAHAPESFNPGVDRAGVLRYPTRFAPIRNRKGKLVPYLYGGSTRDCAIFETVFHNVPIDAVDKSVDLDDFAQRGHGQLVAKRDLRLVDLTSDGLHRLKLPKEELITSAARDYVDTAKWAQALHHQFKDVDGLIWMSKQRDRDRALLLFGDRLRAVLSGTRVGGPLVRNDELRQAILAAALRAGIDAG